MNGISFANPAYLYLLLIIPLWLAFYIWKHKDQQPALTVSSLKGFHTSRKSFRHILRHLVFGLRLLVVALLILVLARPQSSDSWESVSSDGIDIMLALDVSGSMLAKDFSPDRLEASKDVAMQFISGRPSDRIGLVVFSGESFTQCPLTTDHAVLMNLFTDIKSGMIEDGTAIGMGLANAVNRLKDSQALSKVIILLTDGVNNQGVIAPLTAAELAKTFGIRVYTIGVGSMGNAPYPVQTPFGVQYRQMPVEIDEESLQQIAEMTDGKYYRATDEDKLLAVYQEIDQLEKSRIEVKEYSRKQEEYLRLALPAIGLLLLELLIRYLILRKTP